MKLDESDITRIRQASDPYDMLGIILTEKMPEEVFNFFTEKAGYYKNEEFQVSEILINDEGISADCSISFDEMVSTGCPDMPNSESRYGTFSMEIDPAGYVEFNFRY